MEFLFFLSAGILFHVYVLYPLILFARKPPPETRLRDEAGESGDAPSATLFISAFNEERTIREKLANALAIEYPPGALEIVVASDGSTDGTDGIAREFGPKGVRLLSAEGRHGKNHTINRFIAETRGDIVVFSDANSFYQADAVRKLVRHFRDPKVGMVVGKLQYYDEGTNVGHGEGLYFRYESLIKILESRHGTLVAANGSIFAVRKSLFRPLDLDVANDFALPIQIAAGGHKSVFEPGAVALEKATSSMMEEFRRRARIVTRGMTAFLRYRRVYRMLRGFWGFCFISHKLLRWFVPIFLIALFLASATLESRVFVAAFYAQAAFYSLAVAGAVVRKRFVKILSIPFYFCLINLSALYGILRCILGNRQVVWEKAASTR